MLENLGLWISYLWDDVVSPFLFDAESPGHKILLMLLAVGLFVGVMALVLWTVNRPKSPPNWLVTIGFAGPAVLFLGFGLVYPAIRTVMQSFYNRNGRTFVGLQNYQTAFTNPDLQIVLRNTAIWVLLVPTLATFIGLVYAVLVDRTRFERLAKALVFLPMAISLVGASIIWDFVYDYRSASRSQTGLLNQILVWLGQDPYQFTVHPPLNSVFLLVVLIWIQAGFAMTILAAAIRAIPDDIVEAAKLDGLHGLGMFRYITVPSIRPSLVVVLTTIAMVTLKVFDIVRTMTGGNFQTSVVANEFYSQSFVQGQAGMGAALAVLLFIIVIPVVVYNVRQLRLSEEIR